MWPLLHVASGQIASAFKHVWIGLLLAVPAIGYGAERAWSRAVPGLRAVGVLVLVAVGAAEWIALEPMTYPNFRPSVDFLMANVAADARVHVIGGNDRWIYAMYLYGAGHVADPMDIVDQDQGGATGVCDHEWVVATRTNLTGPVTDSHWGCPHELVFERKQPFLNHRGELDTHTSQVWRMGR